LIDHLKITVTGIKPKLASVATIKNQHLKSSETELLLAAEVISGRRLSMVKQSCGQRYQEEISCGGAVPHWRGICVAAVLAGLLGAAGCGRSTADYSTLGLVDVSGTVTMAGSPLVGVTVVFEAENGQFSSGVTDSAGRYVLRIDSDQAGVTPGEKIVRVMSRGLSEEFGEEAESEEGGGPPPEQIPVRYNRDSKLRIVVPSDHYDIELTEITGS
jgi:hypothetical protein